MKKKVGYTRAMLHTPSSRMNGMQVYPTLEDLEKGRYTDLGNVFLEMTSQLLARSPMINYEVLEDANGKRTYRPVESKHRIRRLLWFY